MAYTKVFEKEYENGWMPFPSEETMVTAHALNEYDDTFEHIEDYLFNYDANENIAEEYSDSSTYNRGDYAIYYGMLYKAIVDIDTSESFDPDHWTRVLVTDEIGQGGGGTTVVANPVGEPTDDLETVKIGNVIYDIPGGGGGNANIWTGTQAEYEAQASQIADDTVVLITDDEQEVVEGGTIYSEEEQVIGTWIDGSTLYEKTYDISSSPISIPYDSWVSIEQMDADKIIATTAICDGGFYEGAIESRVYNGYFQINRVGYNTSSSRSVAYITVRYTKSSS